MFDHASVADILASDFASRGSIASLSFDTIHSLLPTRLRHGTMLFSHVLNFLKHSLSLSLSPDFAWL